MGRRASLLVAGIAGSLAALAFGLAACGGGDAGEPDAAFATSFEVTTGGADHSHEVTILCADIAAGDPVTYIARGDHGHAVMLSADDFAALAAGDSVTVDFVDGHRHMFAIAVPMATCDRP